MAIISLVGCNAIGKTTAVKRWCARYKQLRGVLADNQWVLVNGEQVKEKKTKGTTEEKREIVEQYKAEPAVYVYDSARTTHLSFIGPDDPVIIVTCTWELYEKHMRARCAAKNKRFRDDYWTQWKLGYECHDRYVNWCRKNLQTEQVEYFVIEDQKKDWSKVDEYFYELFRKTHNRLLKRKQL